MSYTSTRDDNQNNLYTLDALIYLQEQSHGL